MFLSYLGFLSSPIPGDYDGKESACNAKNLGSNPGLGRSPGEERATHSSILAGIIPWTEEPGGLQSMGLQRVGYDLATKTKPKHV